MTASQEMLKADKTTDDKSRVRLWLRLLRASRAIEGELRERLRTTYNVTLPRFDVMAALYREPEGMLMSQLSKYLMVSNGNVTGLIDRLTTDGLVQRTLRDGDRRTSVVLLTKEGRENFEQMAESHREWINELLSHFSPDEAESLAETLKVFASDWEGEPDNADNLQNGEFAAKAFHLAHGRRCRSHPTGPPGSQKPADL